MHAYKRKHTSIHRITHAHIHMYVHMYVNIHIRIHTHMDIQTYVCMHVEKYVRVCMHRTSIYACCLQGTGSGNKCKEHSRAPCRRGSTVRTRVAQPARRQASQCLKGLGPKVSSFGLKGLGVTLFGTLRFLTLQISGSGAHTRTDFGFRDSGI